MAKIQQNDRMSNREYMKQYMKKRRMDKTFRNIERQSELTAINQQDKICYSNKMRLFRKEHKDKMKVSSNMRQVEN